MAIWKDKDGVVLAKVKVVCVHITECRKSDWKIHCQKIGKQACIIESPWRGDPVSHVGVKQKAGAKAPQC